MKKGKFLIPALAMLMCISAGASFASFNASESNRITAKAEDSGFINLVVGDNTVPVTEADIAGEGAVIAMFTVETAGTYTFASSDLIITVADELGNIIDDTLDAECTVELAVGTYLIVFVPTSGAAGNYVATIMEGVPVVEPTVHEAGQMYSHENGVNPNEYEGNGFGFYFKTEANAAAYNTDWSLEYGATTADNIKLTRNGETTSVAVVGQGTVVKYGETDHYMKFVPWTVTEGVLPLQDGDVFTIGGKFKATSDETQQFNITETTVTYTNGTVKYSTDPVVHEAGQMYSHEGGLNSNTSTEFAFYFKTDANEAAYNGDWSLEYGATSVDNIKLTRNGVTTSVAVTGQGTIVRISEVDHYMKFAGWTTTGVLPVQEGDVFTISGTFKATSDATQQFSISETTVTYSNGAITFSTDTTVDPEIPDDSSSEVPEDSSSGEIDEPVIEAIEVGQMYAHTESGSATGIYFTMAENALPFNSDWSVEYRPVNADNVKITRNGETVSVGATGSGVIVKYGATDYYFKTEAWLNGNFPLQNGDVLTISGLFRARDTETDYFTITETTITYENGAFKFSTDTEIEPDEPINVYEAGQISSHVSGVNPNEYDGNGFGFYFTTNAIEAAYGDWGYEYSATSVDNIKLTRNGETTSVATTGQGTIVRYGVNTENYMKLVPWTVADGVLPLQEGDVLTIGGVFQKKDDATQQFNITETSVTYINGGLIYGDYVTVTQDDISNHQETVESGMYFRAVANDAPLNGDWSLRYKPTSVNAVQFIRDGVTTDVGNTGAETIVKINETDYFVEGWAVGTNSNGWQVGDVYVLNGNFYNEANDFTLVFVDVRLEITAVTDGKPTVVKYGTATTDPDDPDDSSSEIPGDSSSEEIPDDSSSSEVPEDSSSGEIDEPVIEAIEVGQMYAHTESGSATGIYFTMAENALPFNSDWSVEYRPVNVDSVKLTRNGETVSVGNVDAAMIVKYGATDYYFKTEAWLNGNFPLQNGDVLTISGLFRARDTETDYFTITETTITYTNDIFMFSTDPEPPTIYEVGQMYTHSGGAIVTGTGGWAIHFTTGENGAPYNADWSLEYQATKADNVKLVRGGETTSVANLGQGLIVKFGQTEYCFKAEGWTLSCGKDFQEGDALIISGNFKNQANNAIINIAETTVTYTNGVFKFSTDPVVEEYTATFVADGETVTEITFTAETIGSIVLPAVPEKEGYTGAWDKTLADIGLADITFTAIYEEIPVEPDDSSSEEIPEDSSSSEEIPEDSSSSEEIPEDSSSSEEIPEDSSSSEVVPEDSSSSEEIPEDSSSSEEPTVTVHEAGQMYEHEGGVNAGENDGNGFAFYFKTEANDAAYNSDWSLEYGATSVDNIKLTRNGVTTSVAAVGQGTIVRISEIDHYMKLVPWTTTGLLPLQDGDVLTFSGTFKATSDETQQFNITETTVTYTNGTIKFSTDTTVDPDEPIVDAIEVGEMQSHTYGGNGAKGFYFTLAEENALPFDGWSVEYTPVSEDVVKLTRNGETLNVGCVGIGTIVKFGAMDYYFKVEAWMNGNYPLQNGDVLTIGGLFRARDTETDYFTIAETVITYEYDLYQFGSEDKTEVIEAGYIYAHSYAGGSATGVHFAMDDNEAAYNDDWSVEYSPITEKAIKLIRGGQTIEVGNPGAGTIVKFGAGEYYIKAEAWINANFPLQNGDVIVIDGLFKCRAGEDIIKISASYIRAEESAEGFKFKFLNPSVTFVNEDGTVLGVSTYAYEAGVLAEKPQDPNKVEEGYICNFLGWYNGEKAWNFETDTLTSSVVLQAKFEKVAIEYTASFVADGETVEEITFTIETLVSLTLPAVPAKEGYTGTWDKTVEAIGLSDITFTAVYEEIPVEPDDSSSEAVPEDSSSETLPEDSSSEAVSVPEDSSSESKPSGTSSKEQSSGCGSTVGGISVALLGLGAAVALLKKKKED